MDPKHVAIKTMKLAISTDERLSRIEKALGITEPSSHVISTDVAVALAAALSSEPSGIVKTEVHPLIAPAVVLGPHATGTPTEPSLPTADKAPAVHKASSSSSSSSRR